MRSSGQAGSPAVPRSGEGAEPRLRRRIVEAGGQLGEEMRQHAAGIQDQARQTTTLLAGLKQALEEAAIRAQQGAG